MAKECIWTEDDTGLVFETACDGELLLDGNPTDNEMKFCCFCGKRLVYQPRTRPVTQ